MTPSEIPERSDAPTGRRSISFGVEAYRILAAERLALIGELQDEGENHYYLAVRL